MKKLKKLKDKRQEEGIESFESSNELYASVHKSTLTQQSYLSSEDTHVKNYTKILR